MVRGSWRAAREGDGDGDKIRNNSEKPSRALEGPVTSFPEDFCRNHCCRFREDLARLARQLNDVENVAFLPLSRILASF